MAEFIYGVNPVQETLGGGGRKPTECYVVSGEVNPRLRQILAAAEAKQIQIRRVSRQELDRLIGHSHHQGVLLKLEPFRFADFSALLADTVKAAEKSFFIILDGITDPHNFGALLRSAEIAGCHGAIVAKDRSCPVTPVVEKTAAGALNHLPLCQVTNIARAIDEMKAVGIWCYGLAGEEGSVDIFKSELTDHVALVVGSEGKGIRPNVRKHCDALLAIPMLGHIASLNASVAAGVALFEVVRQRQIDK
jgi:23S rRNA (guanosine2251-2'-O)-methyltransferase